MTAKKFWKHALIGRRWLVKHQNPDGSWIGLDGPKVDAYYKASWALMATGQPTAAHRALNYAQQHFLTADGDFLPRGHPWLTEVHYLYPNAYLIIGSMIAGRYEIATPGIRFLLSNQNPDHGGFYSRRTDPGQRNLSDTMSAGAAGLACLAAGEIDAARRVADYLAYIVDLQPAPDDRFFTTIEADGRLRTDVKDDAESFLRIIDVQKENQCWYAVGLPFAYLSQLAEATCEARYRELAQWYFDFQLRCVDPWDGLSSGKAGWGCAMLYRITGEERYRDIALHIAHKIISRQNPDGGWGSFRKGFGRAGQPALTSQDVDLTAEFTLWLSLISTNVLARDSCQISEVYVNNWSYLLFKSRHWLQRLKSYFLHKPRRWLRKLKPYLPL
jgi:hypothetical protein